MVAFNGVSSLRLLRFCKVRNYTIKMCHMGLHPVTSVLFGHSVTVEAVAATNLKGGVSLYVALIAA